MGTGWWEVVWITGFVYDLSGVLIKASVACIGLLILLMLTYVTTVCAFWVVLCVQRWSLRVCVYVCDCCVYCICLFPLSGCLSFVRLCLSYDTWSVTFVCVVSVCWIWVLYLQISQLSKLSRSAIIPSIIY